MPLAPSTYTQSKATYVQAKLAIDGKKLIIYPINPDNNITSLKPLMVLPITLTSYAYVVSMNVVGIVIDSRNEIRIYTSNTNEYNTSTYVATCFNTLLMYMFPSRISLVALATLTYYAANLFTSYTWYVYILML